jgi:homoaconitase
MGAEVGATSTLFPYSHSMRQYLHATARGPVAAAADEAQNASFLSADPGAEYDEVINIVGVSCPKFHNMSITTFQNLSELEPMLNGPFTPDLSTSLSNFGTFVRTEGWKDELTGALIGSCTNSSYEDMVRYCHFASSNLVRKLFRQTSAVDIAQQAEEAGLKAKV